jgi:AraC-like DNA-binding protein
MFPQFNIHSTPLLILVLQGLIFAFLLFMRFVKQRKSADVLMVLILLIMAYHRTTYTIGFMGWYDTFKNTKINYFLFSLGLSMGPLIYLYIRSVLQATFKFGRKDLWHFIPVAVFIVYRLVILTHDAGQEDWNTGYEGEWQRSFHLVYVSPIVQQLQFSSLLLYLVFSIQLFIQYRQKVRQFFSNTYKVELRWIQIFLTVYFFLFIYDSVTDLIDAFIMELSYVHNWWLHFFNAIAIVFIGIKAYFTDLTSLHDLTFEIEDTVVKEKINPAKNFDREKKIISELIEKEKIYLQPELTLKDLAKGSGMSIHDASEVINAGFGYNFNEFINRYRVEEVKNRLKDPANDHLAIMAVAFDSGFNSKASFNRIFKQVTGRSPSSFKTDHKI